MARAKKMLVTDPSPRAVAPWRAPDPAGFLDPFDDLALLGYFEDVPKWHGYARFLGLPHLRENADQPLYELYVEPFLSRSPISPERRPQEWIETAEPALWAVAEIPRLVVLGDPGSGKSTLVSWISLQLTIPQAGPWKEQLGRLVPLPMVLREMRLDASLDSDGLLDAFLAHPVAEKLRLAPHRVRALLERGQVFFLLDGLDEIGNLEVRKALRQAVFDLGERYPSCRFLLTSRVVGYEQVPVDSERPQEDLGRGEDAQTWGSRRFVAPFTDEQIEQFARNWYARREVADELRKTGARDLVNAIHGSESTLRLARIPNLLTLMALIHRVQRRLPHGRALLFEKIAEAYLESIDAFRGLQEVDYPLAQKKRWLSYVGFQMQLRRRVLAKQAEASQEAPPEVLVDRETVEAWIVEAMANSARGADPQSAKHFLDYIGRRSGLLMPRGEGLFAFTHLSFQEYFAAIYLAEQVTSPPWMRGRAAPGATPDDLAEYANQVAWRESLLLLFELLADRPDWLKELSVALFGEAFERVLKGRGDQNRLAGLLASISVDPYSGLSKSQRTEAWRACWTWELQDQQVRPPVRNSELLWVIDTAEPEEVPNVWMEFVKVLRNVRPERLYLTNCKLSEEALAQLSLATQLRRLLVGRTGVANTGWFSRLTNLQVLDLTGSGVLDVTPLSTLRNLRTLDLSSNGVFDVRPLSGLVNLRVLNLIGTRVRDVSPLAGLVNLEGLYLGYTQVSDVGPLFGLVNLRRLSLSSSRVSDLGSLANLVKLHELNLSETRVADLKSLSGLGNLRSLRLAGTGVFDVSPLAGLVSLQKLDLSETLVSDVSQLSGLMNLEVLDLSLSRVGDLSPLQDLRNLRTLRIGELTKKQIRSLEKAIPGLEIVLTWAPRNREP